MTGLTEGRIVHYVLSNGEHRPAIVVRVWRVNGQPQDNGVCQLQVFTDGINDLTENHAEKGVIWKTSVLFNENGLAGTWHWIERAG